MLIDLLEASFCFIRLVDPENANNFSEYFSFFKLLNEKFVKNAKAEVVESERKKQADALLKIEALEKQDFLL